MDSSLSQRQNSVQKLLFISGRISLDLSHTGGKRTTQAAYFEQLHTPQDLADWFAKSELALQNIIVTEADLALAHELREAIWYAAHAIAHNEAVPESDRVIINKFASLPTPTPSLSQQENMAWRQPVTAASVLSLIARDAIELLGTSSRNRLRECANPRCPLLFVDISRPNKRRWCSMERCGLMEKTSRFRAKTKQG